MLKKIKKKKKKTTSKQPASYYFSPKIFLFYFDIVDFYSHVLNVTRLQVLQYMPRFRKYYMVKCQKIAYAAVKTFFSRHNYTISSEEMQDVFNEVMLLVYALLDNYDKNVSANFFNYATSTVFNYLYSYINNRSKYMYESELLKDDEQNPNLIEQFHYPQTNTHSDKKFKMMYCFWYDYITTYYSPLTFFYVNFIDVKISSKLYHYLLQDYLQQMEYIINYTNFNRFYYQKRYARLIEEVKMYEGQDIEITQHK